MLKKHQLKMSKSIFFSPTGISSLDDALSGGVGKSRITHIYGRAGIGRTTLAMQIAASMVNYCHTVYFVSTSSASNLIYEYSLNKRGKSFSSYVIHSLNGFEVVASRIESADFIIIDGIEVYYGPCRQTRIEKTHARDSIRTIEELQLASLARIVRVAQNLGKPLVICSDNSNFAGPELSGIDNPSKHLREVQGIDSTVICLKDVPSQYYSLASYFPQEFVVHRRHRIAPTTSRLLTLMYNRKPHCYYDYPDQSD